MSDVQIIQLQPHEWELYKNLRLQALKEEPQAFSSTYEGNLKEPDEMWKGMLELAVEGKVEWLSFAKQNDELVGMVGAYSTDQKFAKVIAVYVAKDSRGKGVARKLMEDLITNISKNKSIKKLYLEVNADQIPALNLYKNCGFIITEKAEKDLGDGKLHEVYEMEKLLSNE
jgi:ribosomal protein S18 acetylase RimI-like enzyme